LSSLFDKLNMLVRSRMNSVLDDLLEAPAKTLNHLEMRKQVSKDLEALRQQIQHALAYERDLESQLQVARQTRDQTTTDAHQAKQQRDERATAQFEQKRTEAENRLFTLERMLQEHRTASDSLIEQVSKLDQMLAQQDYTPDSKAHPNSPSAPSVDEDESKMEQRRNRLSAPPTAKPKQ
jgi:phage shock protein A